MVLQTSRNSDAFILDILKEQGTDGEIAHNSLISFALLIDLALSFGQTVNIEI